LVYFATHRAGLTRVPRTSADQAKYMRRIKRTHLRRGDFVFFHNKGGVYHVGFFLRRIRGQAYILHAPSPGNPVQKDPVWTNSWFAGTLRR
jgi:cell wall-associated NlpC family hydrolase